MPFNGEEVLITDEFRMSLRLPNVSMRWLCTTVQPTDHQNHSTVTVHGPSLIQKVHKAPLYCIAGSQGFSKYSIFTTEYYAVDTNVTFYDKLIVLFITYCIKI